MFPTQQRIDMSKQHTHEIHVERPPRRWFKTKITVISSIIVVGAAALGAKDQAADALDWIVSIIHAPRTMAATQAAVTATQDSVQALKAATADGFNQQRIETKETTREIQNKVGNVENQVVELTKEVRSLNRNLKSPRAEGSLSDTAQAHLVVIPYSSTNYSSYP